MKDIAGKIFGKLTVIKFSHKDKKKYFWEVECICGKKEIKRSDIIKNTNSKECHHSKILKCFICNTNFTVQNARKNIARFCSNHCKSIYIGIKKKQNIKPRISTQGYNFIKKPEYHRSNKQGYAKIADIVLEEKIGRQLKDGEIAHHINHTKTDDRPENLEIMNKKEHDRLTMEENKIQNSEKKKQKNEKWRKEHWSKKYNKCIKCHNSKYKHDQHGFCEFCWKPFKHKNKKELEKLKLFYAKDK